MAAVQPDQNDNQAPTLMAVIWVVTTISTTLAACRIFTRFKILKAGGKDDIALIISVIMNLLAQIFCTISTAYGIGRHLAALSPENAIQAIKMESISSAFGVMAFCIPKIAVALLLVRLMGPKHRGKWFLYFITGTVTIAGVLSIIFLFVQCQPVAALWDPAVAAMATCWDPSVLTDYTYFVGAYSALCDFSLAVFPIFIMWNLQMRLKRKIAICCVMGLGIFAVVCAIIKITTLPELADHTDYTYATVPLLLWSAVEENVIITCACIPTLGPLLVYLQGKDLKSVFRAVSQSWRPRDRSEQMALKGQDSTARISGSTRDNRSLEEGTYNYNEMGTAQ
ncbi:hypothetical protein MMC11_001442 [Xylographa trunciseda]|nr:hypothetical protein [Xylographa trunciseda]